MIGRFHFKYNYVNSYLTDRLPKKYHQTAINCVLSLQERKLFNFIVSVLIYCALELPSPVLQSK